MFARSGRLGYRFGVARRIGRGHVWGGAQGLRYREDFRELRRFVAFVGYSRSGHSVVAATLDAHRRAAVAHEEGAVLLAWARVPRAAILGSITRNTTAIGHTRGHAGSRSGGYAYDVPGQWQGRWERLEVIGDKHGEDNAMRLVAKPGLAVTLERAVGVPITWLHVVRNPFDNVATMALRARATDAMGLQSIAARYVALNRGLERFLEGVDPANVVTVRHERFVAEPARELERVCGALGLDAPAGYLEACTSIVFASPRLTRHDVRWAEATRTMLDLRIAESTALAGYAFDDRVDRSTR